MQTEPKVCFYLGANSPGGFYSLYDELLRPEEARSIYILKGGPGCGKSSLMRRVGAAMEEHGLDVEYIVCSGDPDSLDAVVIPALKTALVDGTAPHVVEPKYPGLVEEYVNLGACYDREGLQGVRDGLMGCMKGYKGCYQRAYRCLTAAAQIGEDVRALLLTPAVEAKMAKRARGILSREIKKGDGDAGRAVRRFLGAVTWKGALCNFETVEALCRRVYELSDPYGMAHPMLSQLAAGALAAGHDAILCPSPLYPDRLEHLLLPGLSLALSPAPPPCPGPSAPTAASGWTPWRTRSCSTAAGPGSSSPARCPPPWWTRRWTPWPRPRPCTTSWRSSTTPTWTSAGSMRRRRRLFPP